MISRELLLNTGLFIENVYFDKYMKLIEKHKDSKYAKYVSQKHHIIPRFYLRKLNEDFEDNLVTLSYGDHVLAHYYLLNCVAPEFSKEAKKACLRLNQPNLTVEYVEKNSYALTEWYFTQMSTAFIRKKMRK